MTQPVILFLFIMNAQLSKEIVKFSCITPNTARSGWIARMIHSLHSRGKDNGFRKFSNSLKVDFFWNSRVHLYSWSPMRRLGKEHAYFGKKS